MDKIKLSFSIDADVLAAIDEKKGTLKRSTYVNQQLHELFGLSPKSNA